MSIVNQSAQFSNVPFNYLFTPTTQDKVTYFVMQERALKSSKIQGQFLSFYDMRLFTNVQPKCLAGPKFVILYFVVSKIKFSLSY